MPDLLAHISALYGISPLLNDSKDVTKGVLSVNKIVSNGTATYFLKHYRSHYTEKFVEEIHKVKKYFNDGGIPVILPLQNKTNQTFFMIEDNVCALFPYIEARHIEREALTPTALKSMATLQAHLHLIGKDAPFEISDAFKPWDRMEFMARAEGILDAISNIEKKTHYDIMAFESIKFKIDLARNNDKKFSDFHIGPFQLVHGDFLDGNVFFTNNDEVKYVFDFEKTEMCPRVQELIRSINFICFAGVPSERDFEKAELYLEAYHNIFPIHPLTFKQGIEVYHLKQVHSTWIEHGHYIKNNARADFLLPSSLANLKYFENNLKYIQDRFIKILNMV